MNRALHKIVFGRLQRLQAERRLEHIADFAGAVFSDVMELPEAEWDAILDDGELDDIMESITAELRQCGDLREWVCSERPGIH